MSRQAKGGWIEYTESSFSYWRGKDGTRFVLLLYWESAHWSLRRASSVAHLSCWTDNSIEFNVSSTKVGQPIQTLSLIVSWLFSFWICCLRACAVNKKLLFIHYNINVCIWFDEAEIGCLNNIVATFLFDAALSNWTQPVKLVAEIRQVIYMTVSLRPCL